MIHTAARNAIALLAGTVSNARSSISNAGVGICVVLEERRISSVGL
jgi:hypothetical protein